MLCDYSNRSELGFQLADKGVRKSRWAKGLTYQKSVAGIIFRLRSGVRLFGEKPYFHRLEVACPCCGRWIPYGRMHQHAIIHVRGRYGMLVDPRDTPPKWRSIWWKRWYVDDYGLFKKKPAEFQRAFPSNPGGF
jgi:hypothetical protein